MGIKMRIEDPESLGELLMELKKADLIDDIPKELFLNEDMFPMDIPLDLIGMLKKLENLTPAFRKMIKSKVRPVFKSYLYPVFLWRA